MALLSDFHLEWNFWHLRTHSLFPMDKLDLAVLLPFMALFSSSSSSSHHPCIHVSHTQVYPSNSNENTMEINLILHKLHTLPSHMMQGWTLLGWSSSMSALSYIINKNLWKNNEPLLLLMPICCCLFHCWDSSSPTLNRGQALHSVHSCTTTWQFRVYLQFSSFSSNLHAGAAAYDDEHCKRREFISHFPKYGLWLSCCL